MSDLKVFEVSPTKQVFNPFKSQCPDDVKTNQLNSSANQLTCFNIMGALLLSGLKVIMKAVS